ncbi:hypothetical protein ES703_84125 [subsurface metagenome]
MRASKIVHCVDCNEEFPRKELNRKGRCQECRIKIVRANMGQLMAHEGPHYEKWKKAIKTAAARL